MLEDPGERAGRRGAIALVCVALFIGTSVMGCRAALSWYRSATDPTRHQAEDIGFRLANARTFDPIALARLAQGRGADVLEAEDISPCEVAGIEGPCATLLIRLEFGKSGWFAGGTAEVVERCWRYTLRNSYDDTEPHLVDCPEGAEAMVLPPEQPTPTLPDGIEDQLRLTLAALVDAGTVDVTSVRAAVEPLAGGPPASVDVVAVDGNVGVVVGLPEQAECVAGRIVDRTTVEVWNVPRVLAQPGEGGCDAGAAASGLTQHPPH
jgi:hypothetical protein